MSGTEKHRSVEQLHALIDRQLDPAERALVTEHLRGCAGCRSRYESLGRFDAAFRRMPLAALSPAFTRSVMVTLGLAPKVPLVFRLVERAAYVFGLLIVLAFIVTAFVLGGVITSADLAGSQGAARRYLDATGSALAAAAGVLGSWLKDYLPFLFNRGGIAVTAVALAVVIMLAALDRTIGKRFAQRLR